MTFRVGDRFIYVGLANEKPALSWRLIVVGTSVQGELILDMQEESGNSAGYTAIPLDRAKLLVTDGIWRYADLRECAVCHVLSADTISIVVSHDRAPLDGDDVCRDCHSRYDWETGDANG